MARALCRLHFRGPGMRRDRGWLRTRRTRRLSADILAGRHPAHEGRTRSRDARTLQENRLPNRVQGAVMNKSADIPLRHRPVLGSTMAYREIGKSSAPVALFLHGNPTSSYIWRNIMPLVAPVARCIAPDLIGFGQSGKPDIAYSFADQARYLDALIDELGISSTYLVAQDWGTALGFHLAARRPEIVRGLAFMEFIRPMAGWDDFHQVPAARETFRKFRTPGEGEAMILDANAFI